MDISTVLSSSGEVLLFMGKMILMMRIIRVLEQREQALFNLSDRLKNTYLTNNLFNHHNTRNPFSSDSDISSGMVSVLSSESKKE